MNVRLIRPFAALAVVGLSAGCGHSSSFLPPQHHSGVSSAISRHVRDTAPLPTIGYVTSRNSFNTIFATSGIGGGVTELMDFGSIKDHGGVGGGVPECTDPSDQCSAPLCDPNDPDCSVQLADTGGQAKAGDVCGPASKPIGGPIRNAEIVVNIKFVYSDWTVANLSGTIPLGYIYVSNTGALYMQPNAAFTVGGGAGFTGSVGSVEPPYVGISGVNATQLATGFRTALDLAKLAGFAVNPAAYNIIQHGKVATEGCFTSPLAHA